MRRLALSLGSAVLAPALALTLAACGSGPDRVIRTGATVSTSTASSTTTTATSTSTATATATSTATATATSTATASASATTAVAPTKMLVVVVENHSLGQMQGMTWLDAKARRYGYASNYHAITHPSLPNYLAMASGSTWAVRDDDPPSAHPLSGRTVFGQARAHGRTSRVYAESMTSNCQRTSAGRYAVKHNPWPYFVPERALCGKYDTSMGRFSTDVAADRLPNVGLVVPNLCNDAHDCSLQVADTWLRTKLTPIFSTDDFTSGRLAVVVTADEDDHSDNNRVLTVVMWAGLNGAVVSTPLTHYSLSRSWSRLAGAAPLRKASRAADLLSAFGG